MQDKVIAMLNDLIETSKDGEMGFALALKGTKEAELIELFKEGEDSCRTAAAELQDQVRLLGGVAEEGGTMKASVHRGWISVKTVMISRDSKELLEECERGEDYAMARYAAAMKMELYEPVRSIVEKQYRRVVATQSRVRLLRNSYRAGETTRAIRSNV